MPALPRSLRAWASDAFASTLKGEITSLEPGSLPLAQAAANGGYVDDKQITVTYLDSHADDTAIHARVGIFFTEIIINCGCGDDPMPTNAYCELRVTIGKATGAATFALISG